MDTKVFLLKYYHQLNIFLHQYLPYHKTHFEDVLVRYDGGLDTNTDLPIKPKGFDNPLSWQQNELCKSESLLITVDVGNKKNNSATDGYVTEYIDLSTTARFATLGIPPDLNSKHD